MTPQDLINEFTVENGIIQSPGRFEGEPTYVPYFYYLYLDGDGSDDGNEIMFRVLSEDRAMFPELDGVKRIYLNVTDNGFVCHRIESQKERAAA